MQLQVVLVDINPQMVAAWRQSFEGNPEVTVVHGSMLDQQVSAWVTPTNSGGRMDGGLDAVIKSYLGEMIEKRVQAEIGRRYAGAMPVGHATCVPTGRPAPRYLISTPTMIASSEDISDSLNVVLAAGAAFQAVMEQDRREPGSISSVALPGLGANTGRVPVEICADLMWTAYDLLKRRGFASYAEVRVALEEILGEIEVTSKAKGKIAGGFVAGQQAPVAPVAAKPKPAAGPSKKEEIDFDDAEDDFDDLDD